MHLLAPDGSFLLILPSTESMKFSELAAVSGLFLQKNLKIRPKAGKQVNRILSSYGFRNGVHLKEEELIIRNADNSFTKEYIQFTQDYNTGLV
jgi:tRNA1(Val) A37 N6-methylase TrmN6